MRDGPSLAVSITPLYSRQIPQNHPPVVLAGVVSEDEISLRFNEIAEGADPAAAESVENSQAAVGFLVEGGGEDAEVAAGGALMPEKGASGVELDSPFGYEVAKVAGSRRFGTWRDFGSGFGHMDKRCKRLNC